MTELSDHELAARIDVPKPKRYVPPFPQQEGYHWIRRFRGGPAIPLWWCAEWNRNGGEGWGRWAQPDREDQWEYCGPCPYPNGEQVKANTEANTNIADVSKQTRR